MRKVLFLTTAILSSGAIAAEKAPAITADAVIDIKNDINMIEETLKKGQKDLADQTAEMLSALHAKTHALTHKSHVDTPHINLDEYAFNSNDEAVEAMEREPLSGKQQGYFYLIKEGSGSYKSYIGDPNNQENIGVFQPHKTKGNVLAAFKVNKFNESPVTDLNGKKQNNKSVFSLHKDGTISIKQYEAKNRDCFLHDKGYKGSIEERFIFENMDELLKEYSDNKYYNYGIIKKEEKYYLIYITENSQEEIGMLTKSGEGDDIVLTLIPKSTQETKDFGDTESQKQFRCINKVPSWNKESERSFVIETFEFKVTNMTNIFKFIKPNKEQ
jgi:hypothetical protein